MSEFLYRELWSYLRKEQIYSRNCLHSFGRVVSLTEQYSKLKSTLDIFSRLVFCEICKTENEETRIYLKKLLKQVREKKNRSRLEFKSVKQANLWFERIRSRYGTTLSILDLRKDGFKVHRGKHLGFTLMFHFCGTLLQFDAPYVFQVKEFIEYDNNFKKNHP